MTGTDKVCPNIVGVDIGCGMYTVRLKDCVMDFARIDDACRFIPSGMKVWEGRKERFDLTGLRGCRSLRDTKRLECSLGTLGGGNHFIEVDKDSEGTFCPVIHSGSRNLGKQVAEIYQQLAADLHAGKEEYFVRREQLIRESVDVIDVVRPVYNFKASEDGPAWRKLQSPALAISDLRCCRYGDIFLPLSQYRFLHFCPLHQFSCFSFALVQNLIFSATNSPKIV